MHGYKFVTKKWIQSYEIAASKLLFNFVKSFTVVLLLSGLMTLLNSVKTRSAMRSCIIDNNYRIVFKLLTSTTGNVILWLLDITIVVRASQINITLSKNIPSINPVTGAICHLSEVKWEWMARPKLNPTCKTFWAGRLAVTETPNQRNVVLWQWRHPSVMPHRDGSVSSHLYDNLRDATAEWRPHGTCGKALSESFICRNVATWRPFVG